MLLKYYGTEDSCLKLLRSRQKKNSAFATSRNVIRKNALMRKAIMTGSTMQSMNSGQRNSRLTGKHCFVMRRSGRSVLLKWVLIWQSGWMVSSAITIMYLIRMSVWNVFSGKMCQEIIFSWSMRHIIWWTGEERCTVRPSAWMTWSRPENL